MIFDELIANMGISLETYVLLVIVLGGLIFMAKDMRLGLLIIFILSSVGLIIFNYFDRNTELYVYATLLSFASLTISLMISNRRGEVIM